MPGTARAQWLEASSDHFVIYSSQAPGTLHRFATQLESYHAAMSFITSFKPDVPSPSNRVTEVLGWTAPNGIAMCQGDVVVGHT